MGPLKHDAGKPRPELIPPEAVMAMARAFSYGARKYSEGNWAQERGMHWSRLYGATQRHLIAWWGGDDWDPESELHHLDHALACLAMLRATAERGGVDDRCDVGAMVQR